MASITGIKGKSPVTYPVSPGGGGAAPLCTTNNLTITGLYACAENDSNTASGGASFAVNFGNTASGLYSFANGASNTASGSASHAEGIGTTSQSTGTHSEGISTIAGLAELAFTIPAGGTLVTIPGDVTGNFPFGSTNPSIQNITPTTPAAGPMVSAAVADCPIFDGVNTTFNLTAPIDGTTTGGTIIDSQGGAGAHADGGGSQALGPFSCATGAGGRSYAVGQYSQGAASGANLIGQYARWVGAFPAGAGVASLSYVMPLYGSRLYCLEITFATVDATGGQRTYFVRNAMISVDAARNCTIVTNALTLSQDPDGTGFTESISVAVGDVSFDFGFGGPLVTGVSTMVTAKWTEVPWTQVI